MSIKQLRDAYKEILTESIQNETNEAFNLENTKQLNRLLDFLLSFRDVVALDKDVVPICDLEEFLVKLKQDTPAIIYKPQYWLPHQYLTHINDWVTESLDKGYIKPIKSAHSSPLLVVT